MFGKIRKVMKPSHSSIFNLITKSTIKIKSHYLRKKKKKMNFYQFKVRLIRSSKSLAIEQ